MCIPLWSVPVTNQYWAIRVVSCARKQPEPLMGFELKDWQALKTDSGCLTLCHTTSLVHICQTISSNKHLTFVLFVKTHWNIKVWFRLASQIHQIDLKWCQKLYIYFNSDHTSWDIQYTLIILDSKDYFKSHVLGDIRNLRETNLSS